MIDTIANIDRNNRNTAVVGLTLLASGLVLNYIFERHNVFKVWENSAYPISLADLFYPPLCFFLSLMGIVVVVGAMLRTPAKRLRSYAFAIVIPITIFYGLFFFSMQFITSGSDRLGECPGLDQAASSSNVIPESKSWPGHRAEGCGVEMRGIFLSDYNFIGVYGVTDPRAQQIVLDRIADQARQAHTHPVQVVFRDEENWLVSHGRNSVIFGKTGPSKVIRVVNIG